MPGCVAHIDTQPVTLAIASPGKFETIRRGSDVGIPQQRSPRSVSGRLAVPTACLPRHGRAGWPR